MKAQKALVVISWKARPEAKERLILMLKVKPSRGSFWQPVTGKVDPGESYLEAAKREAEEETGFSFERTPQYLGLEYEFEGRHGPAVERAFFLPIFGGKTPPPPKLDPKEHVDFRWVSPAEAIELTEFDTNKKAIERATGPTPLLFLSKQGAFYQEGEEITHARTAALLHKSLQRSKSGLFTVKIDPEEMDVVVEDTPRFVRSYDRAGGLLKLSNETEEKLRPESVRVSEDQTLLCDLENGWSARFLSPAYYEIAKDIRESGGEYFLHFLGRDYRLSVSH